MIRFPNISPLLLAPAVVIVALISPLTANAQDLPSYARPGVSSNDQSIIGRIQSIDGKFHLNVLDQRGVVDSVQLHQGTVINPTGLSLSPGMSVTITGYDAGSSFRANEIDTPYTYDGPAYYGYPGYGYDYGFFFDDRPFYGHDRGFYGHDRGFRGHGGGFHGGGFHGGGGHR